MAESGEEAPTPLASRTYSGKFALRIPPEKHRELAIEAAEQHVSLNQLWCRDFELRVWRHALGRSRVHAVCRPMKAAGSRARGFAELASSRALPSTDPYSSTAARCRPPASRR
ncbi:MAG: toxin-antitoxin system HicB family antitoxin [Adlercreutzia equolifaciens]